MTTESWPRWMQASVGIYLKDVADTAGVKSLVEGLEDRTQEFMTAQTRVEIRVNGPFTERQSGIHRAKLWVNVLITSGFGSPGKNAFDLTNLLGTVHDAMAAGIPLFRTGAAADDKEQIGCLKVTGEVKVFHFGQLTAEDRIRQGMVTAAYYYDF